MHIRRLRETWILLFKIIWDTMQIITIISFYIIGFSIVGYVLFKENRPHKDPFKYFASLRESIFSMYTLLTASNFPDIMIPFIKNDEP